MASVNMTCECAKKGETHASKHWWPIHPPFVWAD